MNKKRMWSKAGVLTAQLGILSAIAPGCIFVIPEPFGEEGEEVDTWIDTETGDTFTTDESTSTSSTSTSTTGEETETGFEETETGFEETETGFEETETGWEETETGFEETETGFEETETGFEETETGFEETETGFEETETGFEETETGFEETETGFEETETGGEETGGEVCDEIILDPRRSLIETNTIALGDLTMEDILDRAALSADLITDPDFTHTRLMDSFTSSEEGLLPGGSHCDDQQTGGQDSLNGFPLQCPRVESAHAGNLEGWFPIAMVNRLDLAASDGSDCGEQRIIMANNDNGRAFMIFEARIPNPNPGCGVAACGPVAKFWTELSTIDDPEERGQELRAAFVDGHPKLEEAGFEPFMSGVNMSFGTGQIRTNSFDDFPWTLREFRFVEEDGRLSAVHTPVSDNSFGPLWNDLDDQPDGDECRQSILDNLEGLLIDDTATMGFSVDPKCLAAESPDDATSNYAASLFSGSGNFEDALGQRLDELGSDLSVEQVANRATFASNCMGCHQTGVGMDLGHGIEAPFSLEFVHVSEEFAAPCDGGSCFEVSQALSQDFLPAREDNLFDFMEEFGCEEVCNPTGDGVTQALMMSPATLGLPLMPIDEAELDDLRDYEMQLRAGLSQRTIAGGPRRAH